VTDHIKVQRQTGGVVKGRHDQKGCHEGAPAPFGAKGPPDLVEGDGNEEQRAPGERKPPRQILVLAETEQPEGESRDEKPPRAGGQVPMFRQLAPHQQQGAPADHESGKQRGHGNVPGREPGPGIGEELLPDQQVTVVRGPDPIPGEGLDAGDDFGEFPLIPVGNVHGVDSCETQNEEPQQGGEDPQEGIRAVGHAVESYVRALGYACEPNDPRRSRMPKSPDRDVEKIYSVKDFTAKLRRLADALDAGQAFEIQVAGERLYVPADASFSVEHERSDDTEELELQLRWQR
jgi:amphi-Trp domain-containing protein